MVAYVPLLWTTTKQLSADNFNHAETQYDCIVSVVATFLAPSEDPTFTGTPTVPALPLSANDNRIANCAFVEDLLISLL